LAGVCKEGVEGAELGEANSESKNPELNEFGLGSGSCAPNSINCSEAFTAVPTNRSM
jgi:hypothetical protein